MKHRRYTLRSVKRDLQSFFLDNEHEAYKYGSPAPSCNRDSVFYKKQLEVIFEESYPHDITGKAVKELLSDRFLRAEPRSYGRGMHAIFIWRHNVRYVSRQIKQRIEIMERFSDDEVNDGCGKHAESLFSHLFEKNQFTILARHTNRFAGKAWTRSPKNLDFIIQKDAIKYGVEVKNTFDYMEQNEFQEKVDMCQFLGLTPMFPLRCPSPQQFAIMREVGGLALKFKTRIFPPGFQRLVTELWNNFRLPVYVWDRIPPNIETNFTNFHQRKSTPKTSSIQ